MTRSVRGRKNQTLLEAMRAVFPDAEAPCGGAGRCGRCRVRVAEGRMLRPATAEEMRLFGSDDLAAGWRLACLAEFAEDGEVGVRGEARAFFYPEPAEAGAPAGSPLCAAVDIGTTTIVCALAETASGRIVGRAAAANPQRGYGSDVVTRIEHAVRSPADRTEMRRIVRARAGEMLAGLLWAAGAAKPERIHICGNPTMLHLWEGADLSGLSRMPFRPDFLESRPTEVELPGGSALPARLLPGISAFIGADISAGILACGLHEPKDRAELLIDIGTNGEIVLAAGGRLRATATAAGPAFEGVAVSCGMPAVAGAVDRVALVGGRVTFSTLGSLPPAGFCGSGLLDLLACLRRSGRMDGSGLLAASGAEGERSYALPSDPPLRITQADVRQLQLAKGAIAAGIRALCRSAGVPLADVARVHLAGAFGSSLSAESALAVGLVPAELAGRIGAAGNTALAGALRTARKPELLETLSALCRSVTVLDLSREPGFEDSFAQGMGFPDLG
jgi:uncharacterized 2Fe-2S/4Fe-4S cluster protein (DUF4445 family)